jgi:5-methylthioadenosine/S-adenosylhomocysteine deaminase
MDATERHLIPHGCPRVVDGEHHVREMGMQAARRDNQPMPRIVLHNALVITMDPTRRVLPDHTVITKGDRIMEIVPSARYTQKEGDEIYNARGKYVLPGLINSHVHTVQHLGRGLADDVDILTWLHQRIWPYESNLEPEDSYINTMHCGLEQLANGVTTVADAGIHHAEPTVRAIKELGIRAALCFSIMDHGDGLPKNWQIGTDECMRKQIEAYDKYHGALGGKLRWWFGLRTILNNSDPLIKKTIKAAKERDTWVHMHVAEASEEIDYCKATRGTTTVRQLKKLGLLGPKFLAVHCVYLDEEEMDLFQKHDVKVSHNPAAALRVMGLPKIVELLNKGVNVSIGTDGAPSNCRNALIDEMYLAAVMQKGRLHDPSVMPATKVLEMVTIDAARTIGLENEIGSIEVGKKADLAVVDPFTAAMLPVHDPISNLVFSAKPDNIESTLAGGKWVYYKRRYPHLDAKGILRESQKRADAVRLRAKIQLPKRFNWSE